MEKHRVTREGDEYVCTCGRRWDIDEDDPHPSTPAEHIADMRRNLNTGKFYQQNHVEDNKDWK